MLYIIKELVLPSIDSCGWY